MAPHPAVCNTIIYFTNEPFASVPSQNYLQLYALTILLCYNFPMPNQPSNDNLELSTLNVLRNELAQRIAMAWGDAHARADSKTVEFLIGARQVVDGLIKNTPNNNVAPTNPPVEDLDETTIATAESAINRYHKSLPLKEKFLTKLGARAVDTIFIKMHNRLQEEAYHRQNLTLEAAVGRQNPTIDIDSASTISKPKFQLLQGGLAEPEVDGSPGLGS